MSQSRWLYLHTVGGLPATYERDPWPALIIIQEPSRDYPHAGGTVAKSLRTILDQRVRCIDALPRKHRNAAAALYGHVRLANPDRGGVR